MNGHHEYWSKDFPSRSHFAENEDKLIFLEYENFYTTGVIIDFDQFLCLDTS